MSVNLVSHPLVQAKLSELRSVETSSHRFRALVKELSTLLGIEASRDLPLKDVPGVRTLTHSVVDYLVCHERGQLSRRCLSPTWASLEAPALERATLYGLTADTVYWPVDSSRARSPSLPARRSRPRLASRRSSVQESA
jgi:hypothetical protein